MVAPLPVTEPLAPAPPPALPRSVAVWNILALIVALVAVAGSLALSLGGLKACPLCYYQRTFVMAAAAVLLMGLLTDMRGSALTSALALPLATAGLCIAGWHVYLEQIGKLECPEGLFQLGTAPQQSLAVQTLLFVVLVIGGLRRPTLAVAIPVGALLAYFCVISAASVKLPPEELEAPQPKICRPPQAPKG
jgi:disulfide bond formation protein DsbB